MKPSYSSDKVFNLYIFRIHFELVENELSSAIKDEKLDDVVFVLNRNLLDTKLRTNSLHQ
jgi:GTPase SAR1 family protein